MNPVEELLAFGQEKAAVQLNGLAPRGMSARDMGKNFVSHAASLLPGVAATAVVGSAMGGLAGGFEHAWNAVTKGRDFRAMLANNEDMRAHHEQNPNQVNIAFSTLRRLNPGFSKDPLVAGAFVRQVVNAPDTAFMLAKETVQANPQPGMMERIYQKSVEQGLNPQRDLHLQHQLQNQRIEGEGAMFDYQQPIRAQNDRGLEFLRHQHAKERDANKPQGGQRGGSDTFDPMLQK